LRVPENQAAALLLLGIGRGRRAVLRVRPVLDARGRVRAARLPDRELSVRIELKTAAAAAARASGWPSSPLSA